jgi:hypothetical protein
LQSTEQLQEAEAQLKLIELGWGNENSAFRQLHTSQLVPDATAEQARAFNYLMRKTTTPTPPSCSGHIGPG